MNAASERTIATRKTNGGGEVRVDLVLGTEPGHFAVRVTHTRRRDGVTTTLLSPEDAAAIARAHADGVATMTPTRESDR